MGIKESLGIKDSRDAVRQVRALTAAAPPAHSGLMSRALVALAGAALLALLLGLGRSPHSAAAVALALLFTALATAGFAWVRSRGPRIRAAYFAVQLPLGVLVFGLAGATTGGGLLLVVLVVQAVLVLPLGWAVVVAALTPLAHVGMARPGRRPRGRSACWPPPAFAFVLTAAARPRAAGPRRTRGGERAAARLRRAGRGARHRTGAQPARPRHPRRARAPPDRRPDAGAGRRGRCSTATRPAPTPCSAKAQHQARRRWPRSAARSPRCARPRPAAARGAARLSPTDASAAGRADRASRVRATARDVCRRRPRSPSSARRRRA